MFVVVDKASEAIKVLDTETSETDWVFTLTSAQLQQFNVVGAMKNTVKKYTDDEILQQILFQDKILGHLYYNIGTDNVLYDIREPMSKQAKLVLPYGIVGVMKDFCYCDTLEELVVPDTVLTMPEDYMFNSCCNLRRVRLSNKLHQINRGFFHGCISLTDIELPRELRVIHSGAFYGCSDLKFIEIPAKVREVQSDVFSKCSSLECLRVLSMRAKFRSGLAYLYELNPDIVIECFEGSQIEEDLKLQHLPYRLIKE